MGCDIHLYGEKKIYDFDDEEKKHGVWVSLDLWKEMDCEPSYAGKLETPYKNRFYNGGRNYNLFTALAGVRSHYFTNLLRIPEPKGFPKDASKPVKQCKRHWGSDGHSHSYLTLKELNDFDWSPYGETVSDFLKEVIPKLNKAKGDETDTDVRIVFWFDN